VNVLAVAGSPRRHGNTNTLARRFLETAAKRGATTRFVYLNGLQHVHGCAACNACKKRSDRCVVRDDLRPVLDAIQRADVVVYASPVYFGDLSGQLKLCFDRHYSFFTSDFACRLKPGKKALMILAQGGKANEYAGLFPRYRAFLKLFMRFGDVRLVRECFALGRTPKQIHVVGDCENALAFLRKAGTYANAPSPHLILLDLRLPDGDGRTVLAALQADPRLHLIPVVVFSSCCSDVETSELYGLGANCCVAKPRDFDDYARAVRMIEECWLVQGNLPKGWRDA
jgi:multimeric flavodoxin WrbA